MILDEIALAENVKVNEQELTQYLIQASQSYGMNPNEFIKIIDQNGQIPSFVAEVARRKALAIVLETTEVSDSKGKVDISTFTNSDAPMADDHAGHDHN
jgi:trigger factor